MTRVATTNYSATLSTQFAWATAGSDQFNREQDLYRLAQALEFHDHSATRGLPISRLASNVVTEANLQDNSISANKLQTNAVTNSKIIAGAVSRDKVTMPWVQAADDMSGGIRLRDISGTYDFGMYMASNGLAALGTGPIAGLPSPSLILGPSGKVSVGTADGTGLFNVLQTGTTPGSGVRIFNPNTLFSVDLYSTAAFQFAIGLQGTASVVIAQNGKFCVGDNTFQLGARLNVQQSSIGIGDGLLINHASGAGSAYIGPSGAFFVGSATSLTQFETSSATFAPSASGGVALGRSGLIWGPLWCTTINANSTLTIAGVATLAGVTCTTLTASGLITANAGISTAGTITPSGDNTQSVGTAGVKFASMHASVFTSYVGITPNNNGVQSFGSSGAQWAQVWASNVWIGMSGAGSKSLELGSDSAQKPSTNTWQVTSDGRTKTKSSIKPYTTGLSTILELDPVRYRYNGLGGTPKPGSQQEDSIGFLAEDIQPIAGEMVQSHRGKLRESDPEETDILTVNTHALTFMFINALKEINQRLEALEKHA